MSLNLSHPLGRRRRRRFSLSLPFRSNLPVLLARRRSVFVGGVDCEGAEGGAGRFHGRDLEKVLWPEKEEDTRMGKWKKGPSPRREKERAEYCQLHARRG